MADIFVDEDGDFVIEGGDLKLATQRDKDRNLITTRLQTAIGGSLIDPQMGLQRNFRGEPPSQLLISRLRNEIYTALLNDGAFIAEEIEIEIVSITAQDMFIFLNVNKPYVDQNNAPLQIIFSYNPNYGEVTVATGENL